MTPRGSEHSEGGIDRRTPTPPSAFDQPPPLSSDPPRPKFQPIEKPISKPDDYKPKQKIIKPKPSKPEPIETIIATPALQPGPPPQLGYAPPQGCYPGAEGVETSKIVNFSEATQTGHRVVSMQQTTRVIKLGAEQFSNRPRRHSGSAVPTPTKFVPGEFRESDYESEVEGARIKPLWKPGDPRRDDPHFRKVAAPKVKLSQQSPKETPRIPTPMEFDHGPIMPILTEALPVVPKKIPKEASSK